ncbi:MAG TPA: hypothetical protein VHE35_03785 [Kofleriaceae bacterium]|nr:hypothetical protein [Kofleriaceae bacterium]
MAELTDEEKRILELMKQLEARDKAKAAEAPPDDQPRRPERDRADKFSSPIGFDDEGKPWPVEGPLPSAEEQAASNREAIKVLEEKLRTGAPTATPPDDDTPPPRRRG